MGGRFHMDLDRFLFTCFSIAGKVDLLCGLLRACFCRNFIKRQGAPRVLQHTLHGEQLLLQPCDMRLEDGKYAVSQICMIMVLFVTEHAPQPPRDSKQ